MFNVNFAEIASSFTDLDKLQGQASVPASQLPQASETLSESTDLKPKAEVIADSTFSSFSNVFSFSSATTTVTELVSATSIKASNNPSQTQSRSDANQIKDYESEIQKLKHDLEAANNSIFQKDNEIKRGDDKHGRDIKRLEGKVDRLKTQLKSSQDRSDQLEIELKNQIEYSNKHIFDKDAEINKLKTDLSDALRQVQRSEQELLSTIDSNKIKIKHFEQQLFDYQKEISSLQFEIQSITKRYDERIERLQDSLTAATANADNLSEITEKSVAVALEVTKEPTSNLLHEHEKLRDELVQTERCLNALRLEYQQKQTAHAVALDQATSDTQRLLTQLERAQLQLVHEEESSRQLIESLSAECQTLKSTLSDKQCTLTDLQRHVDSIQESLADKDADLIDLRKQSLDLQSEVTRKDEAMLKASQQIADLSSSLSGKDALLSDVTSKLNSLQRTMTERELTIQELESKVSSLQEVVRAKDVTLSDQTEKMHTLAEKLREVMKKFNEAKAQYQTAEQALEKDKMSQLNSKDSELLAVRMKLEHVQQAYQDETRLRTQTVEKYGEAQRELSRLRETVERNAINIAELERENSALTASLNEARDQHILYTSQIREAEVKHSKLEAEINAAKVQQQSIFIAKEQEITLKLHQQEIELQQLREQAAIGEAAAQALEQYKKRAQAAMQKANSQVAELNLQTEQMRHTLAETQQSASEARDAALAAQMQLAEAQRELTQAKSDLATIQDNAAELKKAYLLLKESTGEIGVRNSDGSHSSQHSRSEQNPNSMLATAKPPFNSSSPGPSTTSSPDDSSMTSNRSADDWVKINNVAVEDQDSSHSYSKNPPSFNPRDKQLLRKSRDRNYLDQTTQPSASDPATQETLSVGTTHADPQQLVLVNELYSQMDGLRRLAGAAEQQSLTLQEDLRQERENAKRLTARVDELMAFLERTKKLRDDPDSLINTEYLKTCVFKFMVSSDPKDKLRLSNVICTILKLTPQEKSEVDEVLTWENNKIVGMDDGLTTIASYATSFSDSLFGTAFSTPTSTTTSASSHSSGVARRL